MKLTKKYRIIHKDGVINSEIEYGTDTTTEFSELIYGYFETDSKEDAEKYISDNNLKFKEYE